MNFSCFSGTHKKRKNQNKNEKWSKKLGRALATQRPTFHDPQAQPHLFNFKHQFVRNRALHRYYRCVACLSLPTTHSRLPHEVPITMTIYIVHIAFLSMPFSQMHHHRLIQLLLINFYRSEIYKIIIIRQLSGWKNVRQSAHRSPSHSKMKAMKEAIHWVAKKSWPFERTGWTTFFDEPKGKCSSAKQ